MLTNSKLSLQIRMGDAISSAKVMIGGEEQTTDDNGSAMFSDMAGAQSVEMNSTRFC